MKTIKIEIPEGYTLVGTKNDGNIVFINYESE